MSGYDAYQKTQHSVHSRPSLEMEAFLKAVRLLEDAAQTPSNRRRLMAAVRYSRNLWTLIQSDVSSKANPLADHIKADLLSLSLYVDKETHRLVRNPTREGLLALAEIHRNLARSFL